MNKKAFVSAIHRITNTSLGNDKVSVTATNKLLVLITAAGQIIGAPLQKNDESQEIDDPTLEGYVAGAILSTASELIAELGGDSFILLKDAVLQTPGHSIAYQYLYVFTDDIIAVTVTNSYPN